MLLNEIQILLYALAVAFFLVNVVPRVKLNNRKPFNCLQCMTGWCALGLSIASHHPWYMCLLLTIAGVSLGAIVSGIIMRWL